MNPSGILLLAKFFSGVREESDPQISELDKLDRLHEKMYFDVLREEGSDLPQVVITANARIIIEVVMEEAEKNAQLIESTNTTSSPSPPSLPWQQRTAFIARY